MHCSNRIASCPNKQALVVQRLVALVLMPIEPPELTTARGVSAGSFGAGDDADRAAELTTARGVSAGSRGAGEEIYWPPIYC